MKSPRIELVSFAGCPNVDAARAALRAALRAEGLPAEWSEWDRDDPETPAAFRACGSPTVLVNGDDASPAPADGQACRVYANAGGLHGAPEVAVLRAALRRALDAPSGESE